MYKYIAEESKDYLLLFTCTFTWIFFTFEQVCTCMINVDMCWQIFFAVKVHANQNANAYFIFDSKAFSFDYRAKKMSFWCLQTFLCRTVFEQQLVKVRDFERSTNVQLVIKLFFFSIFQKFTLIILKHFLRTFRKKINFFQKIFFSISFGRNC